jgi:type II secretory pathway component PulM
MSLIPQELILRLRRIEELLRGLAGKLQTLYKGLAPRERLLVSAAAVVTLIFVIDLAVVAPMSRRTQRLERQIEKARKDIQEMSALSEEHKRLETLLKGMKPIPKDFSFFHHMESIGIQSGVKIDSIKPGAVNSMGTMKEITYNVRIDKINLFQLVDLLYRIERNQEYPMQVDRISIRPQVMVGGDRESLQYLIQQAAVLGRVCRDALAQVIGALLLAR